MKRMGWLFLILALSLLAVGRCGQPQQAAAPKIFDLMARWVPGDAETVFFLNLKPGGEAGRHWERIRRQIEANPTGQETLDGLFQLFRVEDYGLDAFIVGQAVYWYDRRTDYVVAQVSDQEAAEDALRRHFESMEWESWEQEAYQEMTLYSGTTRRGLRLERLAWTIRDGLLLLSYDYGQESRAQLKALVSLTQGDSLAALPAWRTLRDRLPETPMGLIFLNVAEQARRNPTAATDTSLGTALGQQFEAIALTAVPEKEGMRVEVAGTVVLQSDAPPEVLALFSLPTVDRVAWSGLPADTAIALVAHRAPIVWPLLRESFNLRTLLHLGDTIGLDLEADLAGAEGPLLDDFALAITPPLPDQPISRGLPAGQLLILARGASQAQIRNVQAAMEGRGAIFGPRQVKDMAVQTQTGIEPTGYAISYGFDGDTLFFGSSPDVIGQGVTARRVEEGLVTTQAFQSMLVALPDDLSFLVYFNSGPLARMLQANTSAEQYARRQEYALLEVFDAIGLGLRLTPDQLDGVLYFSVRE